jgi:2-polyprenyl-3-methyl-5-hydroxy-6-metoxy-1,4-benzoquinol methylase
MNNTLFNAQVWEQAWKEDPDSMANRMKRAGVDLTRSFDSKAAVFNEEVFSEAGRRRSERIIGWIEGQGVTFEGKSVLDIGAASGGFSVPFAELGAQVTAVEPCLPLVEFLQDNTAALNKDQVKVDIVTEAFENIEIAAKGWERAFDLVFVSMCPVIADWESVERILRCAKQFCYISLSAGTMHNSLVNDVLPLLGQSGNSAAASDMAYLLHLLYLKGYAYESIVTHELKTTEMTQEAAIQDVMGLLKHHNLKGDEASRRIVTDYVRSMYGDGPVTVKQGGRYGKVLIRLEEQNMYSRRRKDK